ncbi:MAG: RIP metalloprotease RseP, partial [Candidatus Krumholzibacteria bacterium]|nr:RIP metalloprotease RseP [Candidatus Krumholzibacteria bacterium]
TGLWKFGIYPLRTPKVGDVKRGSPADKAGIRSGAVILTINDTTVTQFGDMPRMIRPNLGVAMKFTWEQDGELYSAVITPVSTDAAVEGERLDVVKVGSIGIGEYYEERKISFIDAVRYGSKAFVKLFVQIIKILGKLVTGKTTIRAVGGPLRVGMMAGDMLRWGFNYLVSFLAFFSLNLAIFNLLPILPFDGGHFVLYFAELVSGRRINQRVQHVMMQVGFVFLVALMIFVFFMDFLNIFR